MLIVFFEIVLLEAETIWLLFYRVHKGVAANLEKV